MKNLRKSPLAITGIGCRFPGGADSVEALWNNLVSGKDCFRKIPTDRWDLRKFYHPNPNKPGKSNALEAGFLTSSLWEFDPLFFGLNANEVDSIDPQQRLILESSWEAIEDSGLTLSELQKMTTGVFVGAFHLENYLHQSGYLNRYSIKKEHAINVMMSVISNKVSYVFDFKGPSLSVDTACSSSMTALALAFQSIQNKESDVALIGGVNVIFNPISMVNLAKGSLISNRSRAFGDNANGYGRGEGAGVVVVRPLEDAVKNGDKIYAVIENVRINQDGRTNGITLPSPEAQLKLMKKAYSEIPKSVKNLVYFEAHGTGTDAGDKAESWSINELLKSEGVKSKVDVGSIKSNIGHTEAAAGIAGIIKASLILKHQAVVPSLHSAKLNPEIDFKSLLIHVTQKNKKLPSKKYLLASVNSFGYGGSNGHAILSNWTKTEKIKSAKILEPFYMLPITARGERALAETASRYHDFLNKKSINLNDFAYTLSYRRTHHSERAVIIGKNTEELKEKLSLLKDLKKNANIIRGSVATKNSKVLFVFPGSGPQWHAMGKELYKKNSIYKNVLDRCDKIVSKYAGWSLVKELSKSKEKSRINDTEVLQVALVCLQLSLTELWKHYGVTPDGCIGHSLGETAAAHAAGCLTLREAVLLSIRKGQAYKSIQGKGSMLAVSYTEENKKELFELVPESIGIGAYNDFNTVTLSGDHEELKRLKAILYENKIVSRMLNVNVPYHSPIIDHILPKFRKSIKGLKSKAPAINLYSSVFGEKVNDAVFNPDYWCNNIRQPVYFHKAFEEALKDGYDVIVEISAHHVLKSSIKKVCDVKRIPFNYVNSLLREQDAVECFFQSLSSFFTIGGNINWEQIIHPRGNFIRIPSYPWQKSYHWSESPESKVARVGNPGNSPFMQVKMNVPGEVWNAELNDYFFPFLPDHCVLGKKVFPGMGFIDSILHFTKYQESIKKLDIHNFKILKMIVIPDEDVVDMQTHYNEQASDILFYTKQVSNESPWNLCARANIDVSEFEEPSGIELVTLKQKFGKVSILGDDVYDYFRELGYDYKRSFASIKNLFLLDSEFLAEINFNFESIDGFKYFSGNLDACLQACLAFVPNNEKYVPSEIKKISIFSLPEEGFYVYGEIHTSSEEKMAVNLKVISQYGHILAVVENLVFKSIPSPGFKNWIYYNPSLTEIDRNKVLDISNVDVIKLGLNAKVSSKNFVDIKNKNTLSIQNITSSNNFYGNKTADTLARLQNIISLAGKSGNIRNVIVKMHSKNENPLENPEFTMISSFLKTAAIELRNMRFAINYNIPSELTLMAGNTDCLCSIKNKFYTIFLDPMDLARLKRVEDINKETRLPIPVCDANIKQNIINSKDVFLITGGFGGLGIEVAKWLIKNGAKNIALCGRSGPKSEEAINFIRNSNESGIQIFSGKMDIANKAELKQFFDKIQSTGFKISGVFHSAAVIEDKLFENVTRNNFVKTLNPKVVGALNIFELLDKKRIKFFISFSSITSIVGNQGQLAYGASNGFLDGLMQHMRLQGFASFSINLGPVEAVGAAAKNQAAQNYLKSIGLEYLTIDDVLNTINLTLRTNQPQIGCFKSDWSKWLKKYPDFYDAKYFGKVIEKYKIEKAQVEWVQDSIKKDINSIHTFLKETLSKMLNIDVGQISNHALINDLGIDSILAVELVSAISMELAVEINSMDVLENSTVEKLSFKIAEEMGL